MHIRRFLHNLLSPVMHLKRLETLQLMVSAVVTEKKLSVTQLGRSMNNNATEKSNINRSDRFLRNKILHEERLPIYSSMASLLIGVNKTPDILVDWSHVPNTTHNILRAALVAKGRALTLYEEVHPKNLQANPTVHKNFLEKLQTLFPADCRPTIVTDAGFGCSWFKSVTKLGWNYIGRIRAAKEIKLNTKRTWYNYRKACRPATVEGAYLGEGLLTKANHLTSHFYLIKLPKKYRIHLNKLKKRSYYKCDIEHSRAANEPWLLASSSKQEKGRIFKKYTDRMTIEEAFRDLKSSQFGFSFEHAYSVKIERIQILLMVAMLASIVVYLIGAIAEKNNWHFKFQANTTKTRRVLSLFYLGCRIIKKRLAIPARWNSISSIINELSTAPEWSFEARL